MFQKIALILSVLRTLPGINIVHLLVQAIRKHDKEGQESLTAALASSILAKQGNLDKVISAYASAQTLVNEEWARLRAMVGRSAPRWLSGALKEASAECGFYTTLLMRLTEAKQAGYMPIQYTGVMVSDATPAKPNYARQCDPAFVTAWLQGKTSYSGM